MSIRSAIFGGAHRLGLGLILVGLLGAQPLAAQVASAVGTVSHLMGRALVTRHPDGAPEPLAIGSRLSEGDRIRTDPGARVRLTLGDGSVLTLGERTELTLDWVLHAPEQGTANVLVRVSRGIVRAVVELLLPRAAFEMRTSTAVISARGTEWIAEALPDQTAVLALEGEVMVHDTAADLGDQRSLGSAMTTPVDQILGPGEGVDVQAQPSPLTVKRWGEARVRAFVERTTLP